MERSSKRERVINGNSKPKKNKSENILNFELSFLIFLFEHLILSYPPPTPSHQGRGKLIHPLPLWERAGKGGSLVLQK
jgi:hypothetical protein